jgi:hypothetical protein
LDGTYTDVGNKVRTRAVLLFYTSLSCFSTPASLHLLAIDCSFSMCRRCKRTKAAYFPLCRPQAPTSPLPRNGSFAASNTMRRCTPQRRTHDENLIPKATFFPKSGSPFSFAQPSTHSTRQCANLCGSERIYVLFPLLRAAPTTLNFSLQTQVSRSPSALAAHHRRPSPPVSSKAD